MSAFDKEKRTNSKTFVKIHCYNENKVLYENIKKAKLKK
jgi:hypothetical protein